MWTLLSQGEEPEKMTDDLKRGSYGDEIAVETTKWGMEEKEHFLHPPKYISRTAVIPPVFPRGA